MGRPLNKKFFGNATGKLLVSACLPGSGGTPENCSIIRQRSNLKYQLLSETAEAVTATVATQQYSIVSVGNTDFTAIGAPSNTVGVIFTATGAGTGTGTVAEVGICKLQDTTPNATGEMTIAVTPENAETPRQATITVTGGGGALTNVVVADGGYGYWSDGTGVAQVGGNDGTVDYTVANGSIVTVTINTAGASNADGTVDIADTPDANPPAQLARIINAHQVKTFEGNTYAWPAIAPVGGFRGIFGEADLAEQA